MSTSTYPWQAQVRPSGYLCGGVILSATRVATAAHCVDGFSAADVQVFAGRDFTGSGGQTAVVAAANVMPTYDANADTNDVAILTLASPGLTLGPKVQPIDLVASGARTSAGTPLDVSGYGTLHPGDAYVPSTLQATTVNAVGDTTCVSDYASTLAKITRPDLIVCAAAAGKDSCQGDSGGPLAQMTTPPVLVGLVSSGIGCAEPAYPGLYAEVADPAINTFLAGRSAPSPTSGVQLTPAAAQVGQELTCSPGAWTGAPDFAYLFLSDDGILQGPGNDATYTPTAGDAGGTVSCEVVATQNGAAATADSARTSPVAAAPVAVAPAPVVLPAPVPVAAPLPAPVPPVQARPVDRTAPTATVLSGSCVVRRCSLRVRITDSGYSTGIGGLKVMLTTTYATTCRRKGHTRRCTRSVRRTVKAKKASGATWSVVVSGVRYGRQRFTVVATDRAGNRQVRATTTTLTAKAKRAHKHR